MFLQLPMPQISEKKKHEGFHPGSLNQIYGVFVQIKQINTLCRVEVPCQPGHLHFFAFTPWRGSYPPCSVRFPTFPFSVPPRGTSARSYTGETSVCSGAGACVHRKGANTIRVKKLLIFKQQSEMPPAKDFSAIPEK